MGKSKANRIKKIAGPKIFLEEQTNEGRVSKKSKQPKIRLRAEETDYVDSKSSKKILRQARKQQAEVNFLDNSFGPSLAESATAARKRHRLDDRQSSDDESDLEDRNEPDINGENLYDDLKISEEDERALQMFQHKDGPKTRTLADIILEKMTEKQTEIQTQFSDNESLKLDNIDPNVREMYKGVRDVLKRYRNGKVPKAFKLIPKLRNWEQFLYITEPQSWSAAAMFQATRLFSSGLTQHMAQRFYNLVLLPRVRDDLAEYGRLNFYLYRSLKKALFKPAAFMKGIVLPLLEAGDCTLREAIIIGSVVSCTSIPVLHTAACLLKICEMEYSGACSVFIRIILDKRYALPYRVIDAAVFHFLKFEQDKREMPTLWHNSLLTFAQRYKNDISSEQRDALLHLLKKQTHPKITPEIRRELQAARCRDVEVGQSLALEGEVEFQEDNDYTPMEDDEEAHGSQQRMVKFASGQQNEEESMESDDDDDADEDDDDDDDEEL
ncbi:LOW QUALITY PROTEIN: bystin [Anopheles stephensi]|uniref:LOW QUALITY PROTEIN: bystin n=1 Tax=Anopheles stephensi TaxID=30069 RepID=UPI0016587A1B|nr:LOW QUALITY PROTEIN: bystin [Anopheles stephensi]